MADFRKMLFVLAGLLIIIGTASAQTGVTCTAFVANQPTLRQEGTTEPAGDILITCNGTLVGAQTGPQTLSLYVSGAAITSRQYFTGTSAPAAGTSIPTEATLLTNDCTTNSGTSATLASCAPAGTYIGGNPTQGFLQNGALVFSGFTLPTASPFQVRVTNVRVNANQLAAGSFVTGTVLATFPVQNQQNLVLGAVQSSLSVTGIASTTPALSQCTSFTAGTLVTQLKISELVNTAFKAPAVVNANYIPGQWYQNGVNTESQTVITATGIPGGGPPTTTYTDPTSNFPGLADAATRIRVNFSNIPAGVTISVPVTIFGTINGGTIGTTCTSTQGCLVATTSGDIGSFSQASGTTVTLTAAGSVTYQFVSGSASGNSIDAFSVPVTITYTYTPPSTPATGTLLSSATYAPTTAETASLLNAQIPRFADTSNLQPLVSIAACQTDLLFTFMTNQAGFDTGFEISNTSADPFGTSAQNGTCTLSWYGSGPAAGTSTTTASIAAGTAYANLVSTAAAGFQGYMIATCNFQFGHGFAFITDGYGQPGRGLSQGYLASIIPTPALQAAAGTGGVRNASDTSRTSANGTGESLGN